MSKAKYKPLSFSTTMRNPERMPGFLKCLAKFENQILTNDLINQIVKEIIGQKIYKTIFMMNNPLYKETYEDEEGVFEDDQLEDIIRNSPQDHKEAGFDKGWPSRFDTWYKLPKEFGYCNYAINEPILISPLGHMLIDAVFGEEKNESIVQKVLLHSLMKYQIKNPYRKNLNDNAPLILLLQVIKYMKDKLVDYKGLSLHELSFLICWPNADAEALGNFIIKFRSKYKFGQYTDEIVYEECLKILQARPEDRNYYKMSQITGEAVDEYIRKMRSSGVISLRGNGRFVDYNTIEQEKITYILNNYADYKPFEDKQAYFSYMGEIDENILKIAKKIDEKQESSVRQRTLLEYASRYDNQAIFIEIQKVCSKKESVDPVFKLIPGPARFEFLTSIALVQNFKGINVCPSYPIDDEGLPTSTAIGGVADIVCKNGDVIASLVEVSLMMGRQQVHQEMLPISRHLSTIKEKYQDAFAVFVAPGIHDDVKRYSKFILNDEHLLIKAYGANEFMDCITNYNSLKELASYG